MSGNLVRQVKDETMDVEAIDKGSLDEDSISSASTKTRCAAPSLEVAAHGRDR